MSKLSFPAVSQRVSLPAHMEQALALVRAGKLQEASDLLLGGQSASAAPTQDAWQAQPLAKTFANFSEQTGQHRAGKAAPIDIADVLAKSGLGRAVPGVGEKSAGIATPSPDAPGQFQRAALQHQAQEHAYWLYLPKREAPVGGRALVLMLHGCTQDAQDFARGTRMNAAAEAQGAVVLYPSQVHSANANGCWNWFRPQDQQAGSGEPAMLVAMVRQVMAQHPIDSCRVYVSGLSAGGAMAAVLAQQYPDIFAAAGVHSGLAAGAAQNMMGALSAMKSGAKGWDAAPESGARQVPLIVFHGDADTTVHPRNGEQLLECAVAGLATSVQAKESGAAPDGQRYTRTMVHDASSAEPVALAEHWLLHGAGHAWSGGDARGSHATSQGVNASAEMLRFFGQHAGKGSTPAP